MTKQRLVKMTCGDRNILVKALRSAQESVEPELSGNPQYAKAQAVPER